MSRIGINGFGRIGRMILRQAIEECAYIVAINDPFIEPKYMVYLLRYDTSYGLFHGTVSFDIETNYLLVNGQKIKIFSVEDPEQIDWTVTGAQYIIDTTGKFSTLATAGKHLKAGGKKVIIVGPSNDAPTMVNGVNLHTYKKNMEIVSSSTITAHCVAPILAILHENYEIVEGTLTSVHCMVNKQRVLDATINYHWRDGRSGSQNIIPAETRVADEIDKLLPELKGKIKALAFRVPALNVSAIDLTVRLSKETTYEAVKNKIREVCNTHMQGLLSYTDELLVSSDFRGNSHSGIFDCLAGFALNPNLMKLIAWYDIEVPYSKRIIELIRYMQNKDNKV